MAYNKTYYKPRFAQEVRQILLPLVGMTEEELDAVEITIDARKQRRDPRSVQQRIIHGWRYLVDVMDPEKKFGRLQHILDVRRRGHTVIIAKREKFDELIVA